MRSTCCERLSKYTTKRGSRGHLPDLKHNMVVLCARNDIVLYKTRSSLPLYFISATEVVLNIGQLVGQNKRIASPDWDRTRLPLPMTFGGSRLRSTAQ